MRGSKMVLLVPDATTRDRVRTLAALTPLPQVHVSMCIATSPVDGCVRDTRRALVDGSLAVLSRDSDDALSALSAGADEAYSVDAFVFDTASWVNLVQRTQLRSAARLELTQRLAAVSEFEKLCALGRLVLGVAEEVSDPLSSAMITLQLLQRELEPLYAVTTQLREHQGSGEPLHAHELGALLARVRTTPSTASRAQAMLADVSQACESIAQVARELGLGLNHSERPAHLDLPQLLDKILRLFERAAGRGVLIERDYGSDLPSLFAPRTRVAQTLISLLANALAGLRKVRRDVHRLRISLRANERAVTLTVSDTGPGLAPEVLEGLLTPSANNNGQTGLGVELQVARANLRGLGGDLLIESLSGEGATFVAWFPLPAERDAQTAESGLLRKPEPTAKLPETPRSVLVLEPDANVLGALSRLLRERYVITLAQDRHEARTLLATGARPDAILAAVDDPEGPAFVRWLFEERPDSARRLLLTSSQPDLPDDLARLPRIMKPLEPAALYRALEERFAPHLCKVKPSEADAYRRAAG